MARSLLERRLTDLSARLARHREELAVVDEQLAVLADEADDARIRALVSETPLAQRQKSDAERHAGAMSRRRAELVESIAKLEKDQDDLLDRLTAGPS